MGPETPNPLFVTTLRSTGPTPPLRSVLKDILSLTKVSFNSASYSEGLPVTVIQQVPRIAGMRIGQRGRIAVCGSCVRQNLRHYGLLASSTRKTNIAKARTLLGAEAAQLKDQNTAEIIPFTLREPCPDCGGIMRIIETFRRGQKPQSRAPPRKAAA